MSSHTHSNAHKNPPQQSVEVGDYAKGSAAVPTALRPKLGFWAATALGVVTTSTWIAFSASLIGAMTGGGPVTMIWGYILTLILSSTVCLSLAECAGIWTTAGAQVDWVYLLSNDEWAPALSYATGWLTIIGYTLLGLGGEAIVAEGVLAMAQLANPSYVAETWHVALVGTAVALLAATYGVLGARLFNKTNLACFWIFSSLAVAIMITFLAQSSGNYNSAKFVFTQFSNETGWENRVMPFLTGLSTAAFAIIAFDNVAHMSEELDDPARQAPKAMVLSYFVNGLLGFVFVVVMLFTMSTDLDSIVESATGFPFLEILYQSTGSVAGAIILLVPFIILFTQATADINIGASRCVYSFARSSGFPFPSFFSRINTRLDVPVQATLIVLAIQLPLLWIYVGNTNAFTAFITMPAEALYLSYALPSFLMLVRGRKLGLDADSRFRLGPVVGPLCNIVSTSWSICLTVFLILPPTYPVDAGNMNYSCLIVGALLLFSVAFWYLRGRKHFEGPVELLETLRLNEAGFKAQGSVRDEEVGADLGEKTSSIKG